MKVRPILEYVAGRLGITNTAHSEVTFLFDGPHLRKTEFSHRQIGNTELEYLSPPLAGPLADPQAVAE